MSHTKQAKHNASCSRNLSTLSFSSSLVLRPLCFSLVSFKLETPENICNEKGERVKVKMN